MRSFGISGLQQQQASARQFEELGKTILEQKIIKLRQQHALLKTKLEYFCKHRPKDMRDNQVLREQLRQICVLLNVDPLQSNKSLLNSERFYEELAVQLIDTCVVLRAATGGLVNIEHVKNSLQNARHNCEITKEDVRMAVASIGKLSSGYAVAKFGNTEFIQSIPLELMEDDSRLMESFNLNFTLESACLQLKWSRERGQSVINNLISKGILWFDHLDNTLWFACKFI